MSKFYCNSRKKGYSDTLPKIKPSDEWGGKGYCQQHAGFGTNHVGQGRCKKHGGSSPIRSGAWSKIKREDLQDLITHFENLEDPLDLLQEVSLARAFLTRFINEYDDIVEALLEWHFLWELDQEKPSGRPPSIPSQTTIVTLIENISKIVKRIQDIRADNAVSRSDLFRIMGEMGRVVQLEVDDDQWEKIKRAWLAIQLA